MSPSQSPINIRSIGWALLSQAIWIPLVAIDALDRWQAMKNELQPAEEQIAAASSAGHQKIDSHDKPEIEPSLPTGALKGPTTGLMLGRAQRTPDPLMDEPIQQMVDVPGRGSFRASRSRRHSGAATVQRSSPAFSVPGRSQGSDFVLSPFTGSDLLGGTLTLTDLDGPAMPPLARAERARWARNGDPMAPLPKVWREPLRKALNALPNPAPKVAPARVVHVPSRRVTHSTPVPLAMQSDGSVDILSKPDSPEVIEEIQSWSSRQSAPAKGTVKPTIVHLEPLPEDAKPMKVGKSSPPSPNLTQSANRSEARPIKPLTAVPPLEGSGGISAAASSSALSVPVPAVAPVTPEAPSSLNESQSP